MKKAVVLWIGTNPFANCAIPPTLSEVLMELGAKKNGIVEMHVDAAADCATGRGRPATSPLVDVVEFGLRAPPPNVQLGRVCLDEILDVEIASI